MGFVPIFRRDLDGEGNAEAPIGLVPLDSVLCHSCVRCPVNVVDYLLMSASVVQKNVSFSRIQVPIGDDSAANVLVPDPPLCSNQYSQNLGRSGGMVEHHQLTNISTCSVEVFRLDPCLVLCSSPPTRGAMISTMFSNRISIHDRMTQTNMSMYICSCRSGSSSRGGT